MRRRRTANTRLVTPVTPGPPTARPDGALPPAVRWLNDDPYLLARVAAGLSWGERHALERRRQHAVDALDALDREAVDWMTRKQAADREALQLHQTLWPAVDRGWARRPPRPDQPPPPPIPDHARPLGGVALRRVVMSLLQLHGQLALRDLHLLLILYGFVIASPTPVKYLADALRYEVHQRRARRVQRGVYAPNRPEPHPRPDPLLGMAPEDWYPTLVRHLRETAHRDEGALGQLLGAEPEGVEVEPVVGHGAVEVPGVHALADDGQPPRRERDVEVDVGHVETGPGGVADGELVVRREATGTGGVVGPPGLLAGVGPVDP